MHWKPLKYANFQTIEKIRNYVYNNDKIRKSRITSEKTLTRVPTENQKSGSCDKINDKNALAELSVLCL
ncbi:hypothetical protein PsorP6_002333 [Peronosclerospora sorghi]|uniref:Uncharacterized protein n=1 Tax=Peronosclerospora sorghi TaxID=230839 RepID=A0ACC0WXR8_9STRA|nr:hypothetical protein PsorP6_002333 [Peronosclerospora sorghi]